MGFLSPSSSPSPARTLLCLFLVLLFAPASYSQPPAVRARFAQDENGNLIVNATTGQRVFVNGKDVVSEISSLKSQIQSSTSLMSSLQARIDALSVALAPSYLYAIGGNSEGLALASVERFDGKTWTPVAPMNSPRQVFSAITYNNAIYAVGGWNDNVGRLSSVERFDGKSWSFAHSLSLGPRDNFGIVVYQNLIYVIGGWQASGSTDTIETYDGASAWKSAGFLPKKRSHGAAVVYDNKIFLLGGTDGSNTAFKTAYIFDGSTWGSAPSMQSVRVNFGAAVLGSNIFAVAGDTLGTYLQSVERYDGGASWTSITSLSALRNAHKVAAYNGNVYAVGGAYGTPLANVDRLDYNSATQTYTWTVAAPLSTARQYCAVAVL